MNWNAKRTKINKKEAGIGKKSVREGMGDFVVLLLEFCSLNLHSEVLLLTLSLKRNGSIKIKKWNCCQFVFLRLYLRFDLKNGIDFSKKFFRG